MSKIRLHPVHTLLRGLAVCALGLTSYACGQGDTLQPPSSLPPAAKLAMVRGVAGAVDRQPLSQSFSIEVQDSTGRPVLGWTDLISVELVGTRGALLGARPLKPLNARVTFDSLRIAGNGDIKIRFKTGNIPPLDTSVLVVADVVVPSVAGLTLRPDSAKEADGIYTFASSNQSAFIDSGQVLVGDESRPFLRRAVRTTRQGSVLLVSTEPAYLDELGADGTFGDSAEVELAASEAVPKGGSDALMADGFTISGGRVTGSNVLLHRTPAGDLVLDNFELMMSPRRSHSIVFDRGEAVGIRVSLTGTTSYRADLRWVAKLPSVSFSTELPLFCVLPTRSRKCDNDTHWLPPMIIAGIPIPHGAELELGINFAVSGSIEPGVVTVSKRLQGSGSFQAGLYYDLRTRRFTPLQSRTFSGANSPVQFAAGIPSLTISLGPELTLKWKILGTFGPLLYAGVGGRLALAPDFSAQVVRNTCDFYFALGGGVQVSVPFVKSLSASATFDAFSVNFGGNYCPAEIPFGVATVAVVPESLQLEVGATRQIAVLLRDAFRTPLTGRQVAWQSSNPTVASVSNSGVVTGLVASTQPVRITALSEGLSAGVDVSVTAASVASVTVTPTSTTLELGVAQQLTATLRDTRGNTLTGRTVAWSSSNPSQVSVSNTGVITGVAVTNAAVVVSATSEGRNGTAQVNVTSTAAIALTLAPLTLSLSPGSSVATTATLTRNNFNASVALSVLTSLPVGLTSSITQPGTGTSGTVRFDLATNHANFSNLPVTIRASGTGIASVDQTVTLNIASTGSVAMSLAPAALALSPGGSGATFVTLSRTNYTGIVTLSVPTALPAGLTARFAQPATGNTGNVEFDLATNHATFNDLPVTIRASGAGLTAVEQTVRLSISTAGAVAMTLNPTSLTVTPGSFSQTAATLTRTNFTGSVSLSVPTSLPAGLTATITQPGTGTSGSVRFDLASSYANFSNLAVTIRASGTSIVAVDETVVLNVATSPPASKLGVLVHPSNTLAGTSISPAVQIAIQTAAGATVATATNSVTVTLGSNTTGATITGTSTRSAVNGVAVFNDLKVDRAGTYTLVANSVGLTGTTSSAFTVTAASTPGWQTGASMLTPREWPASTALNGLMYVVGGYNTVGDLSSVESYNPATNAWTTRASMPAKRYGSNGVQAIGSRLYFSGGFSLSQVPQSSLFIYDMGTDTWVSSAPNNPSAGGCGASGAIAGQLYVLTACATSTSFVALLNRYDPATNTWTTRAVPSSLHVYPAAAVLNGKLYVLGGIINSSNAVTGAVEVYDPATNSWGTAASMPTPRYGATAQVSGGKIYVIGGQGALGLLGTTEVYDPSTNTWSSSASMPTPRVHAASAVIGSLIHVVGGSNGAGLYYSLLQIFTP